MTETFVPNISPVDVLKNVDDYISVTAKSPTDITFLNARDRNLIHLLKHEGFPNSLEDCMDQRL